MPYAENGTLTTDTREIAISETWDTQTEWEAYQSINGIEISNGVLMLEESVVAPSAIHRWPISEGSGTTAADTIGNEDMDTGTLSWTSGTYVDGFSLSGDGTDDYGEASTLGTFGSNLGGGLSITFTIETVTSGAFMGVLNSSDSTAFLVGNDGQFNTNGNAYVVLRDNNANSSARELDSAITDGSKYRFGATIDGTDPTNWILYLNGSQAASSATVNQGTQDNFSDFDVPLTFFARNSTGMVNNFIDATMDDIILYDSVLTSQEITDDYNRQPWS